jgi:hypothetical protein
MTSSVQLPLQPAERRLATHQILWSMHVDFEPDLFPPPRPDRRSRASFRFPGESGLPWALHRSSKVLSDLVVRRAVRPKAEPEENLLPKVRRPDGWYFYLLLKKRDYNSPHDRLLSVEFVVPLSLQGLWLRSWLPLSSSQFRRAISAAYLSSPTRALLEVPPP